MIKKFFHFHRVTVLLTLLFALALPGGCASQIGDECSRNDECPPGSQCDITIAGGYCTMSDCEPNTCPAEGVCVQFTSRSSYCMRHCESNEECRPGHSCQEDPQSGASYCYLAN